MIFSKEQVEWIVQFETFTRYWIDVKEIILRHSATNGAENQTPEDRKNLQHKSHVADPDIQADLFLSYLGNTPMETARIGVSRRPKERSSLWEEKTGSAK
ncbi:uncharacterized protein RAG0_03508 [Rhynchosporium agropyri]|uniref:Uncharacterized protein n=1 Tax=Rhynchosporium agropyri TaxID=914238 RepID=A0A1E1K4J0_9HELO|nr:uncharacterized protein RAG0_03508 [Rhynchosporium agropyri]